MKSSAKLYQENLYPFQDGILALVKKLDLPFYLTGGTALSRGFFNHRYFDDLYLFVNRYEGYERAVDRFFKEVSSHGGYQFDLKATVKSNQFSRFVCYASRFEGVALKIDLVNDIAARFGRITQHAGLDRIDSWRNILSNKITALFRQEPKDLSDIWVIARHKSFPWKEIFEEAKQKDAGADPLAAYEIIRSFPPEYLGRIKWTRPVVYETVIGDLNRIADDILKGKWNIPRK